MSDPRKPYDQGTNRTGVGTSLEGDEAIAPAPQPAQEPRALLAERTAWSRAVGPVGTMPPPTTARGLAKGLIEEVEGKNPRVLIDLLIERLAFERTGTRLYEALLAKHDAAEPHPGGPVREEIERLRDEELQHLSILKQALESLGADPTAMTPSADVTAVLATGLVQVLADPRVTLTEALKAIQLAELADNDGWLLLTDLAARLGHDQLALRFQRALAEEEEHLARVRSWVAAAVEGQAGLSGTEMSLDGGEA